MRWLCVAVPLLTCLAPSPGLMAQDDATVLVSPPQVTPGEEGNRVIQDVTLATALASYTLRYDVIDLDGQPGRVGFAMWAPSIGYTPLGIIAPSGCLWYNQGFFIWTFDDLNIQSYRADMRVVRPGGADAVVEYVWDTPKAVARARFAMTAGSDKLLFLGSYEPKGDVRDVKLRLMSYPATFSQPWARTATTAARTLTAGDNVPLDLAAERWVLLEDTLPGRAADGSAGLLLGDTSAFSSVVLNSIGGYAEHVDLTLAPGRRSFALGLYEFPSMPDYAATRAHFGQLADAESAVLAHALAADPASPLPALPVDAERSRQVAEREERLLSRPAETWRPSPESLEFGWARQLPGPPVRVALLCPRWSAYETMELARRVEAEVRHQYFDSASALTQADMWPYAAQTGTGALSLAVAERNALRICRDEEPDVILVARVRASAIPVRARDAILAQVRGGRGLFLAGGPEMLEGWPVELTAQPDDALVAPVLSAVAWGQLPGFRAGDAPPLRAYRYGQGRVVVLTANMGEYGALVPANEAVEGLDGATDRALALAAMALLATAGRGPSAEARIDMSGPALSAGRPQVVRVRAGMDGCASVRLRVQDDCDQVLLLADVPCEHGHARVGLPALPAGRRYFIDAMAASAEGECLGIASTAAEVRPQVSLGPLELVPGKRVLPQGPVMVGLADGGALLASARVEPAVAGLTVRWEVWDAFGRLLAQATSVVNAAGVVAARLDLPKPATVCHYLEATLLRGAAPLFVRRERFTVPTPYPYDEFTFLMWSYAGGNPILRHTDRACYEMGADMMDLCHMGGFSDGAGARQYEVSSRSGLRLVPYITRIAGDSTADRRRVPSLFDPTELAQLDESVARSARQAMPYGPAAYTLGDENYLCDARQEVDGSPEAMAAFRTWLQERYGTIAALNRAWRTELAGFDGVAQPMWIEEAAKQTASFAPWLDHRAFMDAAFADVHERLAASIRNVDPGAKVGYDGLLGYHWQAGYDFDRLTRKLDLNQVYTTEFPQGEMVRSLASPGALTGEWGNAIADREDGFSAIPWHNLFTGHNSCWWWTSWGCDYIPFNPDGSVSKMGEWYFDAAREVRSGPGALLVQAQRDHSGIAVLYSQADMHVARLAGAVTPPSAFAGDGAWLSEHRALLRALEDLGYQYQYVAAARIEESPQALDGYKVLFLPLASCVSDELAAAIRAFVERGGTVVADGRVGLLTGNGTIRDPRPLDELFGVRSGAGQGAFAQASKPSRARIGAAEVACDVLEPDLVVTTGTAFPTEDGLPASIAHAHGAGQAVLLNASFQTLSEVRDTDGEHEVLAALDRLLRAAGARPCAELTGADGRSVLRVERTLFEREGARYLGVEQDILQPALPARAGTLRVAEPAFVYDVRAGRPVGHGRLREWPVEISRGRPLLFALMPYRVAAVKADVASGVRRGRELGVAVRVVPDAAEPGFHVVRLDVFAPGANQPHRQYSRNITCPAGLGSAVVPLALNDPAGTWQLVLRDVATGVTCRAEVAVMQ